MDFERVKDVLIYQLNHCIINGDRMLIFNVKQHSTFHQWKLHRTMRRQLCTDLKPLPQVQSVQVKRLREWFCCRCHDKCRSINRYFRKNHLRCNRFCYFTLRKSYIENCIYTTVSCPRKEARKTYNAHDNTFLLIITFRREACPAIRLRRNPKPSKRKRYKNYISSCESK